MSAEKEGKSTVFQSIVSSVIFFGTIGLVVLLVVIKKKPTVQADTRQAPAVKYERVKSYDGDIKINVTGVTMPYREITIAAEVTGAITVKTDDCQAGRFVGDGKHLLSIDSEKYKLQLERIDSEIEEANARLTRFQKELEAAIEIQKATDEDFQNEFAEKAKREKLYKAQAISETEWNQSKKNYNAAMNAKTMQDSKVLTLTEDVKAQQSLVKLKGVQKKEAQIDFDNAIINAPSNGVVISDDVEQNDFVQVGQKLLVFEDTKHVEVKCDLRADQLQSILEAGPTTTRPQDRFKLPRLEAKIRYEANDRVFTWTGVLDRYDGLGLDEVTRTAPCRILVEETLSELPDPDLTKKQVGYYESRRTLVRGMYVSVELNLKKRDGLVAIPAEALRAGNKVWVYQPTEKEGTGKLQERQVKVLNRVIDEKTKKEVVVAKAAKDSIQLGELLITSPIPQPTNDMDLRKAENETTESKASSDSESESGDELQSQNNSPAHTRKDNEVASLPSGNRSEVQ